MTKKTPRVELGLDLGGGLRFLLTVWLKLIYSTLNYARVYRDGILQACFH
jgi:preprotein translocase subunit SecD